MLKKGVKVIDTPAAMKDEFTKAAAEVQKELVGKVYSQKELDMALKGFGVKRLVIGHTPNLTGIEISHGGKLVRIDTGNSRYYKGQPSWLEIAGGQVTPHVVTRSSH